MQKLQDLEKGSAERPLLEKGMHAMQRRSGAMQLAPDEFVITSLDVIVRKDEKLGEGGFGQVFRGDWQGVAVAVKVFEKGIPQPVRTISGLLSIILIDEDTCLDLAERTRRVEASPASAYSSVPRGVLDCRSAVCGLRVQVQRRCTCLPNQTPRCGPAKTG